MDLQKMALQIAKLKHDAAKQHQAHLLCAALIAMLRGR